MEEWKDEEDLYDVLEESQYAEAVAKRREEGGQLCHRHQMLGHTFSLGCPASKLHIALRNFMKAEAQHQLIKMHELRS